MAIEPTPAEMARLDFQANREATSWLDFWEDRYDLPKVKNRDVRVKRAEYYLEMAQLFGAWG